MFRPCIDLHDGVVKQIVGSTLTGCNLRTNFVAEQSPAYFAQLYQQQNFSGGHVIKLGPGCDEAAKEALAAWPGNLQIGGGINAVNAASWLDAGAQAVIVTSFCFANGEFLENRWRELLKAVGKAHLVLDLSCRKRGDDYFVVTDRWQNFTELKVERRTLEKLASGAAEFLIHAVDVEGKQAGIDCELLALLAENSPIECVYAGGIRSLEDVKKIDAAGQRRIHYTIGSALDIFGGSLPYQAVVDYERDLLK